MRTVQPKPEQTTPKWYLVDAQGKVLGRLATAVATILRGKHRPLYAPHMDLGDHVIVINAEKVHLTGDKLRQKMYQWYSGYPGGLKEINAGRLLATQPEKVIEWAVAGMLPKNRLGRVLNRKLKVYRGPDHPHQAQLPEKLELPLRGKARV